MNLQGLAAGMTAAVTPLQTITVQISAGYTTSPDGTQVPAYTSETFQAQVQALAFKDIQQMDAVNVQGVRRAVYVPAQIAGVIRVDGKGGDILVFPEFPGGQDRNWLAAVVLETWDTWTKVGVTLQDR